MEGMTAPPPGFPIQADPARCVDGLSELRSVETVEAEHDAHGRVAELGAVRIELVAEDLPGCVGDPEHGCVLGELDDEEGVLPGAGHRVLLSVRCPSSYTRMRDVRVLEVSPPGAQRRAGSSTPSPLPCRLCISRGAPLDQWFEGVRGRFLNLFV